MLKFYLKRCIIYLVLFVDGALEMLVFQINLWVYKLFFVLTFYFIIKIIIQINVHAFSFHIATGRWPEQENPHTRRINSLIDYHKILTSIEKRQRERKKFQPKRSFIQYVRPSFTLTKI